MNTGGQENRYLLVEVGQYVIALPMSGVSGVHLLGDAVNAAAPVTVPVIDLASLIGQDETRPTYAVVLVAHNGMGAISVDGVRPVSTVAANDRLALPPLIARLGLPFSSVVRQAGLLVPVMSPEHLIAWVQHVSPELIVEKHHAS